jgi:hypothetical protein
VAVTRLHLLALLAVLLLAAGARADGPIGADGEPITTSSYAVDFTRGPVLSSSRATGLAGAITAIAEGAEGGLSNPAAVANRYSGSADWWDYWLAFGFTLPVENGDFFNSGDYLETKGDVPDSGFAFFNPGFYLQLGRFAFGLDLDIQTANLEGKLEGASEESFVRLREVINHVQVGWLFWDGQLALGGGLTVQRQVVSAGAVGEIGKVVVNHTGFGGELGVLLRPNGEQWRLGASLFSTVRSSADDSGDSLVNGYYVPNFAERPWQGNVGFAYQFGGRPLNPRFTYVEEFAAVDLAAIERRVAEARSAHQQRIAQLRAEGGSELKAKLARAAKEQAELEAMLELERAAVRKSAWQELRGRVRSGWPRRYALISAEASFVGRVNDGVGVESFLLQTVQRSGQDITVTPRLAVESEVWPRWMRARTGIYLEPSRFEQSIARLHGTVGLDIRVLHWDVFRVWPEDYLWQISIAGDFTSGYASLSMGVGGWY